MPSPDKPPRSRDLADRYAVLLEAARVLAGTRTLDELYRETYRETARVLETDGFYISRFDEAQNLARVVFYADEGHEHASSITYRGSDSVVLSTGKPALVKDDIESQSILTLGHGNSRVTRAAITTPIRIQGRVAGAISAQSYRPGAYDAADLQLLQALADIAAVAMDNADQLAELERRRREAERIEEIGRSVVQSLDGTVVMHQVAEAVRDLMASDGATIWLLDDHIGTVGASRGPQRWAPGTVIDLGEAISRTLREDRILVVEDVRGSDVLPDRMRLHQQDGSLIAVPLHVAERVTGFLSASSLKPRAFGSGASRLLQRLGSQASVALGNAELHAKLQALSLTDPLTGLANRRHLRIHLAKETAAAVRGRRLAVVIFDINGFKAHNDSRGHLEGDRALRLVARLLSSAGRAMNLVARFGGDEFISVLSESSHSGAKLYADRVCAMVAEHPELSVSNLTLSYGIAVYDPAIMDVPDDLIRIADQKLYEAKAHRRATRVSGDGP